MEDIINQIKQLVNQIGVDKLMIIAAVLLALIILYFMIRSMRLKKYRKAIVELQNQMSGIKSLPIQYRLGRVKSIAKNTPSLEEKYVDFETRYNQLTELLKTDLAVSMNEIDEQLYYGKLRKVKSKIANVKTNLEKFEKEAQTLLSDIEEVTEVENAQRIEIIHTKEKYRSVMESYEHVRLKLEEKVPAIQDYFKDIDQEFIRLEDLMNQQDFNGAKAKCKEIDEKINYLEVVIRDLPTYISIASKYIPSRLSEMKQRIEELTARGFKLETMKVPQRYEALKETLNEIYQAIADLNLEEVGSKIDAITSDINVVFEDFETEEQAYGQFEGKVDRIFKDVNDVIKNFQHAINEYERLNELYVFENPFNFVTLKHDVDDITIRKDNLTKLIRSHESSYTYINASLDELDNLTITFESQLKQIFEYRDQLYLAEKRAVDELENINIVLLEIKSEIKNRHLPMINNSYKDYIKDSYKKADAIRTYCRHRPIMLKELTQQVDEARDIIYKLYDNVHNLVVTAEMVEEAIVYGNRYRTSFLEVNTELTKAEVLFRNGEYTKALETCVDIIEKIEPGSYEKLIKKSKDKVLA